MRLIPYEKLTLTTGHSPEEIKRRLEAGVGVPRGGDDFEWSGEIGVFDAYNH